MSRSSYLCKLDRAADFPDPKNRIENLSVLFLLKNSCQAILLVKLSNKREIEIKELLPSKNFFLHHQIP